MVRILLAAVAALFFCVPVAGATIITTSDYAIDAYDDDGSGKRQLFNSTAADVDEFLHASVHPNGTLVSFTGVTRNYATYSPSAPALACGLHCNGIHTFAGNTFTRLSPEGKPCSGYPCATFSGHSEPASDGTVVGQYYAKMWDYPCRGNTEWCSSADGSQTLIREPAAADAEAQVLSTPGCDYATEPIPHPADPSLVMFIGCSDYDATPTRHFVSTIDAQGTVQHLFFNHGGFYDPAWSPDGSLVVTSERGPQPGLWITPVSAPDTARWVLETSSDSVYLGSPRLAGDKLLFLHEKDVWSIPADCHRCPLTQATRLTNEGDITAVGWTAKALTSYVRPTSGGGDGGGAGGGVTPTPSPSPSPSPSPGPGPVLERSVPGSGFAWAGVRTLRGVLRGRLAFKVPCGCRATAVLRVGRTIVARGAGRNGATLKTTKAGRRKLRRLERARLKLTVTVDGGSFTRALTLRR